MGPLLNAPLRITREMADFAAHAALFALLLTSACFPILAQTSGLAADSSSSSFQPPNPLADSRDRVYYPGDTERFKPLARKLVGNILLDQKEIWTSPFHMHTRDAKWWLGFGAATAAFVATDQISALHPNPSRVAWSNNVSNIGTSYTLVPLVGAFYGYGVFRDNPKAREVG